MIKKNCPPSPNIFFINEKRIKRKAGDTDLYFSYLNITMETSTNKMQGTPENAKAKRIRLPENIFVKTHGLGKHKYK